MLSYKQFNESNKYNNVDITSVEYNGYAKDSVELDVADHKAISNFYQNKIIKTHNIKCHLGLKVTMMTSDNVHLFISKIEDQWYLIHLIIPNKNYRFYRCDELNGLLEKLYEIGKELKIC